MAVDSTGNVIPIYFNLVQNNTITNTLWGIVIQNDGVSGEIGDAGSVVRFNHINIPSNSLAAFFLKDCDTQGSMFLLILEGNTVVSAQVAVVVTDSGTATTYLTLSDNSFNLGSAAAAGSTALDILQSLMLTQSDNTFTGFAEIDGGSVTPTILSPIAAAPGTQFPLIAALNGATSSPPTGGSGTTTTTTSAGKPKHHAKQQKAAAAPLEFAAVAATSTNNLKFSSKTPGNDAALLAD